jgi:hypothetical protein
LVLTLRRSMSIRSEPQAIESKRSMHLPFGSLPKKLRRLRRSSQDHQERLMRQPRAGFRGLFRGLLQYLRFFERGPGSRVTGGTESFVEGGDLLVEGVDDYDAGGDDSGGGQHPGEYICNESFSEIVAT